MGKYYFFKTVKDGSRERLRPLAGQTERDGSAINPNFNTKGSKMMRESYPVGTVFCSRVCELQGGFYAAGDLYPMDINMGDYKSEAHRPTADMVRAYKEYKDTQKSGMPDLFSSVFAPIEETLEPVEVKALEVESSKFSMLEMLSSDKKYSFLSFD